MSQPSNSPAHRQLLRGLLALCLAGLILGGWVLRQDSGVTLPFLEKLAAQLPPPFRPDPLSGWHPLATREGESIDIRKATEGPEPLSSALELSRSSKTGESGPWGLRKSLGSLDARRFNTLSFWVRTSSKDAPPLALDLTFTLANPERPHEDAQIHAYIYDIGSEWSRILVPLKTLRPGQDWQRLTGINLTVIQSKLQSPLSSVFLISALTLTEAPAQNPEDGAIPIYTEAQDLVARETPEEHRQRLKNRLVGWPQRMQVDPNSLPADDTALLQQLARDTWRGLEALTDRETGLPLDRIQFAPEGDDPDQAWIGDYTNITNIGFYLLSITAAVELDFISRAEALDKIATTLRTLETVETHEGFFFNYYNTTTLARTDDLVSFVDSSWLTSGLMVIRQAFPELAERASRLINQGNYRFFYDESNGLMSHGFNARSGQHLKIHYGVFYTEARLGSLIGIGKGDLPTQQWFQTARTMAPELTWQQGVPVDRRAREAHGVQWFSGHYHWLDEDFVPSWGGSMFEALMPRLVLDEERLAPQSLGANGRIHSRLQRRFALETLGYRVWGMSPSSTPDGQGYTEYGVSKLGVGGYKAGAVTPHAAVLALMAEPEEALVNIRRLIQEYKSYGDYGLYDAVDPTTGQVARNYLCLDQAMILIALANHLKPHSIQNHFSRDPITQAAQPILRIERF